MMFNVYAIKDKKSTYSTDLLLMQSDDLAKRHFGNLVLQLLCSNENHLICNFPDDFDLFRVGSFDPENGSLSSCQPVFICCAANFVTGGE